MTQEKKDKHFIKKPVYPGGPKAFKAFITKNLVYPPEALKQRIEGTVFVKYAIDYKGNVVDVKVKSGIGHGCDEEAIRLIKMLKFEVPKTPRKLKVLFHKTSQIHFRLPQQSDTYQYTWKKARVSKKSEDQAGQKSNKPRSYGYVIRW